MFANQTDKTTIPTFLSPMLNWTVRKRRKKRVRTVQQLEILQAETISCGNETKADLISNEFDYTCTHYVLWDGRFKPSIKRNIGDDMVTVLFSPLLPRRWLSVVRAANRHEHNDKKQYRIHIKLFHNKNRGGSSY